MQLLYDFRGLNAPIGIDHSLGARVEEIVSWPHQLARDGVPLVRAMAVDGGYIVESPFPKRRELTSATDTAAVSDIVMQAISQMTWENPDLLTVHTGGVVIENKLWLISGTYHAGKSLLTAHFAAFGFKVFSDDAVPIDGNIGFALGICPRLRLPLPEGVGRYFRRWVRKNTGANDDRYNFVRCPKAQFGEAAPIGGLVKISRGPLGISRMTRRETYRELEKRDFSKGPGRKRMLKRLSAVPGYLLRYDDPVDAVKMLGRPLWRLGPMGFGEH